ncbi:MAG: hypothetical protein GXX89_00655 [Clostridiales bacterium]|nr:hypothetical protein [Clostridiales bacterium]
MAGFAAGLTSGVVQFWLLSKFTRLVTGGGITPRAVLLGLTQLMLPLFVLLAVAFLRKQDLLYAGVGISVALIAGSLLKYILVRRKSKGGENQND